MEYEKNKYDHLSAEYQFIGWDELTEFLKSQYTFLFGRLRRTTILEEAGVPLRVRAASNPGNIGHEWVRDRFIDLLPWAGGKLEAYYESDAETWVPQPKYIPAKLEDNPHIDKKSYMMSLANMDPIERQMYIKGNWRASVGGAQFKREWFEILNERPRDLVIGVRHWDLAATAPLPGQEENPEADWTAGAMIWVTTRGQIVVEDIQRFQGTPGTVKDRIVAQTRSDFAMAYELGVPIFFSIEQEPGASGKTVVYDYQVHHLAGYPVMALKSSGQKVLRSVPLSSQAQANNVKIMAGYYNQALFNEMDLYPYGDHDDQVDALSGAHIQVSTEGFLQEAVPVVQDIFDWRSR